ncbi:redoxin domain-containing protein [Neisseriaceae bacterium PsAf]|nr:redoxin domain-containing protein [Neisseriaceae bacterium PsAf]MCV2503091.1 peroxiredoxin [Neisseriaceae bacterium]
MTINNTLFQLTDDSGNLFEAEKNLPLIVYFYPRDNTPGCTVEASEFSDLNKQFQQLSYQIVGISRDSVESHRKFKEKYDLSIKLLSDPDSIVCNQYDVIKLKNLYGKQVKGIERSTFILDKNGSIVREYRKVRLKGHAQKVLDDLKEEN